jgi:hypothetical protein
MGNMYDRLLVEVRVVIVAVEKVFQEVKLELLRRHSCMDSSKKGVFFNEAYM